MAAAEAARVGPVMAGSFLSLPAKLNGRFRQQRISAFDPDPTVVVRKSGRSPKPLACHEGMIDQPWQQRFQAWRRALTAQSQSGWSRGINPHPFA